MTGIRLLVDDRRELFERGFVALAPGNEEVGNWWRRKPGGSGHMDLPECDEMLWHPAAAHRVFLQSLTLLTMCLRLGEDGNNPASSSDEGAMARAMLAVLVVTGVFAVAASAAGASNDRWPRVAIEDPVARAAIHSSLDGAAQWFKETR